MRVEELRAALRHAETLPPSDLVLGRIAQLRAWIAEHEADLSGPALGMPGVPWDAYQNRVDPTPLRAAMPVALPGGKWGAGPQSFDVATDAQGNFINPESGPRLLLGSQNGELLRAEWPIPTVWASQIFLQWIDRNGNLPGDQISQFGWEVVLEIESTVDNTRAVQSVPLNFGPGTYPLQYIMGSQGQAPLVQTYDWVAQQLIARLFAFRISINPPGPQPKNVDGTFTVQMNAGLWSATLPPQRGAHG